MSYLSYGRACTLAVGLSLSVFAGAAELPEPQGPVILEVRGAIENTNGEGVAAFDREMLESLRWPGDVCRPAAAANKRWPAGVITDLLLLCLAACAG